MSTIKCDVVAKNKVLFSGELHSVMVPGSEGELGIMANHEPFVTALHDGVIWARTKPEGGTTLSAAIMGGYVQCLGERVIVLCDKTREIKRINEDKVRKDITSLEERSYSKASLVQSATCCQGKGKPVRLGFFHDSSGRN